MSPTQPDEAAPDPADAARRAAEDLDLMPLADAYHGRASFAPPSRTRGPSRLVPLLSQIRGYSRGRFRIDALAGLTVAALTLPSAMAYAEVAGVPVTTGLYTLIAPVLIYAFLSSTPRLWSALREPSRWSRRSRGTPGRSVTRRSGSCWSRCWRS